MIELLALPFLACLVLTLMHELQHRSARYGLASMCIGVGQGIAMIVERV